MNEKEFDIIKKSIDRIDEMFNNIPFYPKIVIDINDSLELRNKKYYFDVFKTLNTDEYNVNSIDVIKTFIDENNKLCEVMCNKYHDDIENIISIRDRKNEKYNIRIKEIIKNKHNNSSWFW